MKVIWKGRGWTVMNDEGGIEIPAYFEKHEDATAAMLELEQWEDDLLARDLESLILEGDGDLDEIWSTEVMGSRAYDRRA
jgi:hypothetical protein